MNRRDRARKKIAKARKERTASSQEFIKAYQALNKEKKCPSK
jgi:hypothetical protein